MSYSRYTNTQIKVDSNKRRVQGSTIYPPIPLHPNDIYVLTTVGDTLYSLAFRYYRSVNYYWIIAEGNEGLDKSTQNLVPGTQLRIPSQLEQILTSFEDLNNI